MYVCEGRWGERESGHKSAQLFQHLPRARLQLNLSRYTVATAADAAAENFEEIKRANELPARAQADCTGGETKNYTRAPLQANGEP